MQMQTSGVCCALGRAIREGRYQEAIQMLDGLLDVVPEHSEARIQRARLYALIGRQHAFPDSVSEGYRDGPDLRIRVR